MPYIVITRIYVTRLLDKWWRHMTEVIEASLAGKCTG